MRGMRLDIFRGKSVINYMIGSREVREGIE